MSTLIHEHSSKGYHRLVQFNDNGTSETGEWFPADKLAILGKFLAHAGAVDDNLPLGVFTLKDAVHQVLC